MKSRSLLHVARLTVAAGIALAALGTPAALAEPLIPTSTTVTASASSLAVGAPVVYTVKVSPAPSTGSVSVADNGYAIPGCEALPLTAGTATCATTAPNAPRLHLIYGLYTSNGGYDGSGDWLEMPVVAPSTTVVTASPKLADPGAAMTYVATVTPRPATGGLASVCGGGSCGGDPLETVDFAVDGVPVADCLARPVSLETGVATCKTAVAPAAGGRHEVTASYTGNEFTYLTPSVGTDTFDVTAPAVTLSTGTLAFGSVAVGASGSQQVTVTNSGTRALSVGAASAGGPFSIAASTCTNASVTPGESCAITVAFAPTASGAAGATLTVETDAGAPTVALGGIGTVTATTPPPPTGATLPPNAKTTFTATTSSSPGGPTSVTVPLKCPNGVACTLDGTVVISTSDLLKSKTVRAAAAETQTVARFAGVRVAAGKVREIKLKLSPAFIKAAQKRGTRLIHATLTVNTTFTDGTKATRHAQVKIRIPKAPAKKKAAAKQAPRFTG